MNKVWKCARGEIKSREYFGILGILNITPDSFFDGGKYLDLQKAINYAETLISSGVDVIDIGAESTRPGSCPINMDEEQTRLMPVLATIRNNFNDQLISVDTWHADTAEKALNNGADIINDISACRWDPELLDIVTHRKPGYILMHCQGKPGTMQKEPKYSDLVEEIKLFFEERLGRMTNAGLPEDHIVLDVGIGFGKSLKHNLSLLSRLNEFLIFGRPLLVGLSMKSFLGELLNLSVIERMVPTAIASVLAWQKGAFWHRVHNAQEIINSLTLASMIK